MARTPYPITGIVKDVDGSTTFYPGSVKVFDVTLGEILDGTVASDGSFSVDIANLTSAYSNGDALQVIVYNSALTKSTEFRHTVNTGLPGYDAGTLYMHWTKPFMGTATLMAGVFSNKNDSNEYTIDLYDRASDAKLLSADVLPNSPFSFSLLFKGIPFDRGICIIRESDAANTVEVQLVVK
jgi:hypothetical protein